MSRIAKKPVPFPANVQVRLEAGQIHIKGPKGELGFSLSPQVLVLQQGNVLRVSPLKESEDRHAGAARAILANMVKGVTSGFQKKLDLVGVGYRAQAQGRKLNLTLGFSHPVVFDVPTGITIETPTPTEILVKGTDRQLVGQVAANIRSYRPPEPYKGKGVKYSDEIIARKETKKK
ncbi:50S ribosomal subunit protein L6 [Gammaproteobacteria bacterium]